MATPDNTLISRAEFTTISNTTTKRFALVADGQTIELGSTGWRDISGLLQNVESVAAGMVIALRTMNSITIKIDVTPSADGNIIITKTGLGDAWAPDTSLFDQGRGGAVGVSANGNIYINPATKLVRVTATLSFETDNAWPSVLPGVALGQPIVI